MPRKPRLAIPDLHIEKLSGSAQSADAVPTFVDDFSGEIVAMKPQAVATVHQQRIGPLKRKQRKLVQAARERAVAQSAVAQREAAHELIKQRMQSTERSPAKPGERAIALGAGLVIIEPAKPWRRY